MRKESQTPRITVLTGMAGLGWPLLCGAAATSLFYALLLRGPLDQPILHRYFAGHPVSFFETGMFFIGISALLFKFWNLARQTSAVTPIRQSIFPDAEPSEANDVGSLQDRFDKLSSFRKGSYLGQRIRDALNFVGRKGGGQGLDDELKYLADQDLGRQHDSYALVRIIIWATPMLGFLGTVIGITRALGDLDSSELANNIQGAMDGLLSGLYVAFDTTALALSLSIVLMFVQFLVERIESQLLNRVDEIINGELAGRFDVDRLSDDPQVAAIQRVGQAVITATEQLVKRQTQLWHSAMEASQEKWSTLVEHSSRHLRDNLDQALAKSLDRHAAQLSESARATSDRALEAWSQWRGAMRENAELLNSQQAEFARQGQAITQIVKATGDIVSLEGALNKNLDALAGSKNFEDTVMSLSAAIHLLTTRLEQKSSSGVQLNHAEAQERAA